MSEMKSSILAGIIIGLAGWCNLACLGGIIGAVIFSFGLITICYLGLDLYTGKAGSVPMDFFHWSDSMKTLGKILLGNIIGTAIVAFIAKEQLEVFANITVESRMSTSWWNSLACGIGCGALMEFAVWGYKEKKSIILILLCVPGFIMSGMFHSIADSFYILCSSFSELKLDIIPVWLLSVLGNFIGCNIRRVLS